MIICIEINRVFFFFSFIMHEKLWRIVEKTYMNMHIYIYIYIYRRKSCLCFPWSNKKRSHKIENYTISLCKRKFFAFLFFFHLKYFCKYYYYLKLRVKKKLKILCFFCLILVQVYSQVSLWSQNISVHFYSLCQLYLECWKALFFNILKWIWHIVQKMYQLQLLFDV